MVQRIINWELINISKLPERIVPLVSRIGPDEIAILGGVNDKGFLADCHILNFSESKPKVTKCFDASSKDILRFDSPGNQCAMTK